VVDRAEERELAQVHARDVEAHQHEFLIPTRPDRDRYLRRQREDLRRQFDRGRDRRQRLFQRVGSHAGLMQLARHGREEYGFRIVGNGRNCGLRLLRAHE
jgi:hypothetical protein